jgi:hypothetical protein
MSWQRPQSDLRASDAERERVVAFLREHSLAGRLTHEELEERIGAAYASVTIGDLERLIDDLPRARHPVPAQHPHPVRPQRPPRRHNGANPALVIAGVALLMITGLPVLFVGGVIALLAIVFALSFALGPFLLLALIIVLASRRRRPPPPVRWGRVA